MQMKALRSMEDKELIAIARAMSNQMCLSVREKARRVLKERGFRFVGMRVEKDE